MTFQVKEGDYAKMGACCKSNDVTFTFECEKEDDCAVVLIDKETNKRSKVAVPKAYCLGSLRSVTIRLDSVSKYLYMYNINGNEKIDPYAYKIVGREKWMDEVRKDKDYAVYGAFFSDRFDWKDDVMPEIPKHEMVMYKLNVRGFSMDKGAPKSKRGSFSAIESKIPYLKEVGVTSVELMPVYEFEEIIFPKKPKVPEYIKWRVDKKDIVQPKKQEEVKEKTNLWGYGDGNYFAVKESYAKNPDNASKEFKTLVRSLHKNNLECVLEFYFPEHTNHNLIIDALRYWVKEYHVDGFHLLGENLPITAIAQDVILSRTKIFYTHFDFNVIDMEKKYKNLYVYKDEYFYPVRQILNHVNGDMVEFTNQQKKQGKGYGFVNYIASNNGFTLADLFMYNDKHNEANGENNEDGSAWNISSNYGIEGPSRKKYINQLRKKQWRNALIMLFMGQGVPLIYSGDEFGNSQSGNNNAYCQDNETGWVNWNMNKASKAQIAFVRDIINFRKKHPLVANDNPFIFSDYKTYGAPDVSYHGESAWLSGFDYGRMNLGVMYCGDYDEIGDKADIYIAYNFYTDRCFLALPKLMRKKKWYLAVDSSRDDMPVLTTNELLKNQNQIMVEAQSICILVSK